MDSLRPVPKNNSNNAQQQQMQMPPGMMPMGVPPHPMMFMRPPLLGMTPAQQQLAMQNGAAPGQMMQPMMMMPPMMPNMSNMSLPQMQATFANLQAQAQGLARAVPERLTVYKGFVKAINERGFAFVTCPAVTTKFRRDVYFDSDEIARGELTEGKEVDFILRRNERNQPTGKVVPPNGIFSGILKKYQEDKGFGFISCDEAARLFDMDVWIHGKEVRAAGVGVGQEMQFYIQLNCKNQPQAVAVRRHEGFIKKRGKFTFIESAEVKQTYCKDAFVKDGDGFLEGLRVSFLLTFSDNMDPQAEDVEITGDVQGNEYANGDYDTPAANIDQDTMYEGIVKSCGPQYGFVESQEIKRRFGKDVFVPASIQKEEDIAVGDAVLFTMQINVQGNPQAIKIEKRGLDSLDDPVAKKQRI